MNTAAQAPEDNTTAADDIRSRDLGWVRDLTTYAMQRSYVNLQNFSADWSRQEAEEAGQAICEQCSEPFERRWPATQQRFCSPRCRRSAARRREMARIEEIARKSSC